MKKQNKNFDIFFNSVHTNSTGSHSFSQSFYIRKFNCQDQNKLIKISRTHIRIHISIKLSENGRGDCHTHVASWNTHNLWVYVCVNSSVFPFVETYSLQPLCTLFHVWWKLPLCSNKLYCLNESTACKLTATAYHIRLYHSLSRCVLVITIQLIPTRLWCSPFLFLFLIFGRWNKKRFIFTIFAHKSKLISKRIYIHHFLISSRTTTKTVDEVSTNRRRISENFRMAVWSALDTIYIPTAQFYMCFE